MIIAEFKITDRATQYKKKICVNVLQYNYCIKW